VPATAGPSGGGGSNLPAAVATTATAAPDALREQFELLVRSRYGLVIVDTLEEERVEELFKQIASELQLHYYSWTRSRGLRRGTWDAFD